MLDLERLNVPLERLPSIHRYVQRRALNLPAFPWGTALQFLPTNDDQSTRSKACVIVKNIRVFLGLLLLDPVLSKLDRLQPQARRALPLALLNGLPHGLFKMRVLLPTERSPEHLQESLLQLAPGHARVHRLEATEDVRRLRLVGQVERDQRAP